MGDGEMAAEASHIIHKVAVDRVNDGAGSEEEKGFEKGMGKEVEHGGHVSQSFVATIPGNPEGEHHHTDLRHGGVGQYPLDIKLCTGNDGGENGADRAYPHHNVERGRR